MIELFVDGGSRGNPGPSGGGFVIFKNGKLVGKGREFFGFLTNNQAEYLALRAALREAYRLFGDAPLSCHMDSQLVVEQMNGHYKVKKPHLKPLFTEIRRIADQFKSFSITHIPREENYLADHLANQAMDEG